MRGKADRDGAIGTRGARDLIRERALAAVWAGGGDTALVAIKESCGRIQRAAARIIDAAAGADGEVA